MIPSIIEVKDKFPEYATLSQATISFVDMGERTISAQVKIDGDIVPDFSYDWEIMYRGEKFIQPLRKPQSVKDNTSLRSSFDLVFHHWATWQLKRFFFTQIEVLDSGTLMPNNYVYPIAYTLSDFVVALNRNLDYYYGGKIKVELNATPSTPYLEDKVEWSFSYTSIWDAVTQINEKYDVRWVWNYDEASDVYWIKIGYDASDVSHVFEYGYDKGLTKIERQVQNAEIRNRMFGRGGSQNLPYRYFKKFDPNNTAWQPDPDWIPELESIYFSELRGKTFRDYVRGWKAKHYGGQAYLPATDAYTKGYTDETFNPIEYVEDVDSIAEYGIIQGGLDNNEEIFPTIQKRDLGNGLGRADEVVAVETILVDEPTSNTELAYEALEIKDSNNDAISSVNKPRTLQFVSNSYEVPLGRKGYFVKDFNISAVENVATTDKYYRFTTDGLVEVFETRNGSVSHPLTLQVSWVKIINADTSEEIQDIVNIESGTRFYIHAEVVVSDFFEEQEKEIENYPTYGHDATLVRTPYEQCSVVVTLDTQMELSEFFGEVIGNYTEGVNRISGSTTIPANGTGRVTLETDRFEVEEDGATNVDVPTRITSSDTTGSYSARTIVNALNINNDTNEVIEVIDPLNIKRGFYRLRAVTDITNLLSTEQTYKVELMPSYIYYPYDSAKWRPTFNIWIKDIWGTTRYSGENDTSYAQRIWTPILGDRQGNEAKVVFSSGLLSGHSDYEFSIVDYAFDDSKSLNGVKSHWRLTLAKSDADMEATGKWLPSIAINAKAGDHFYFIGIDMPHQYVLWAEEEVDTWKRENMPSAITPTWSVVLDKIRIHTLEGDEVETLLSQIQVGAKMHFADKRFTEYEEDRHIQSITITWSDGRIVPDVEVILSDENSQKKNLVENLYSRFDSLKYSFEVSQKGVNSNIDKINFKTSIAKDTAQKAQQSTNIVASDRQLYRHELANLDSEKSSLEDEFDTFVSRWKEYVDANGLVYRDVNGLIYRVREANALYDRYNVAHKLYKQQLNKVIATNGIVQITPDYVSARDEYYAARTAMNKAISTQTRQEISDLDYLKDAFDADKVLDSDGVVLSRLVSVKDKDGNVVAGIYGGANDTLNGNGFESTAHGTLMQFAGATSAQDVANSKYRVYEDGTLIAEAGVFGGLIRRGAKTLTPENIDYYSVEASLTICDAEKTMTRVLDVVSTGSYLVFDGGSDDYAWSNVLDSIEFDIYDPNHPSNVSLPSGKKSLKAMLPLVGTQVMIYFMRGNFEGISLEDKMLVDGAITGRTCWKPSSGSVLIATCKMQADSGKKAIVWEYEIY